MVRCFEGAFNPVIFNRVWRSHSIFGRMPPGLSSRRQKPVSVVTATRRALALSVGQERAQHPFGALKFPIRYLRQQPVDAFQEMTALALDLSLWRTEKCRDWYLESFGEPRDRLE